MKRINKLVLIGNGFDLAHGLKTSYKNFLDWYMCDVFLQFCDNGTYTDSLLEIRSEFSYLVYYRDPIPKTLEEVFNRFSNFGDKNIIYKSDFFKKLLEFHKANNWVDIERSYFKLLKEYFLNLNLRKVNELNKEFDFLIKKLSDYIKIINEDIFKLPRIDSDSSRYNLNKVFAIPENNYQIRFLNFNYTETLYAKHYADKDDIIHIHGRVADFDRNPIIFGYGDESDPVYQNIEDSGENVYLEHIKSFGYFRTANYYKLLSYIDSEPYIVYIVGHSCGLSDRVLLNQIFEHTNCQKIEVLYHVRDDGSDNFKEITQEISRHFKPQHKDLMRRKVGYKNSDNTIPQNKIRSFI